MTREELIVQLRGVHLPPAAADSAEIVIAQWPLWTLAAIALLFGTIRWWRQNTWRREARAALARIEAITDKSARWRRLLGLAIQIAQVRGTEYPLPPFAYRAPETVDGKDTDALARHIRGGLSR